MPEHRPVGWRHERLQSIALMGVWTAVLLHVTWATVLLISPGRRPRTTGLASLYYVLPSQLVLALLLLGVVSLALYGLLSRRTSVWRIISLTPQQVILGVSAAGAVRAMYLGQFADGVQRSHLFLVADQAPVVIAFLIHTATIAYLAVLRWR